MTANVKAMDSQRWISRIQVFQLNGTSPRSYDDMQRDVLTPAAPAPVPVL